MDEAIKALPWPPRLQEISQSQRLGSDHPNETGPSVSPVRKSDSLIQDKVDVRGGLAWFTIRIPLVPHLPWFPIFMVESSRIQAKSIVVIPVMVLVEEVLHAKQ